MALVIGMESKHAGLLIFWNFDYYCCFTASILLFLLSLGSGDADRTSTLLGMFFVKNLDE